MAIICASERKQAADKIISKFNCSMDRDCNTCELEKYVILIEGKQCTICDILMRYEQTENKGGIL